MTKRGIVIVSVMFGLFALSFSALGLRALTVGPDAPTPTASELASRQAAANSLENRIAAMRADAPPALPDVPARVAATPAAVQVSASATRSAQGVGAAEQYAPTAQYEEDDEGDDEGEYREYEEGDHDDD